VSPPHIGQQLNLTIHQNSIYVKQKISKYYEHFILKGIKIVSRAVFEQILILE
jgi:hypothetical protein